MVLDLGKLLHNNFRRMAEAGCKHIQIDEPYFTPASDEDVRAAVDAINLSLEGLPDDIHVSVHICQATMRLVPITMGKSAIVTLILAATKPITRAGSSVTRI